MIQVQVRAPPPHPSRLIIVLYASQHPCLPIPTPLPGNCNSPSCLSVMAMHLEHRHSAPPDRYAHRWVSSPPAADALQLISRQHQAVAGHTFQPPSAYSLAPGSGSLFDLSLSTAFMPGCCVLSTYSSHFLLSLFGLSFAAPNVVLPLPDPLHPPSPPHVCR
jgi:hypothetical protein